MSALFQREKTGVVGFFKKLLGKSNNNSGGNRVVGATPGRPWKQPSSSAPVAKLVSATPKGLKKLKIAFEYYAPLAKGVFVVGAFNEWDHQGNALKKDKSGKWKAELSLPRGRYEYRYLVDGVWENDQRPVECVPNAFGSWNSVVTVQ